MTVKKSGSFNSVHLMILGSMKPLLGNVDEEEYRSLCKQRTYPGYVRVMDTLINFCLFLIDADDDAKAWRLALFCREIGRAHV